MIDVSQKSVFHPPVPGIEWPTVALAALIYGGYLAATFWWAAIPVPVLIAIGAWLVAWQSSLQHEVLHGHPTRKSWINDAIGWPPISLWLPYLLYRQSHLVHHRDEFLTDPIEDPESSYFTRAAWHKLGRVGRALAHFNTTLFGRLTIGPMVMIVSFLAQEVSLLRQGHRARARRRLWMRHAVGVAAVLVWVVAICGMPLWLYLFGFVYCGAALSRIRSYAEHRYADSFHERTAIVENSPVFGLLFLYNNLHVLHHQRPGVPWYRIPALYKRDRAKLIEMNGGLVYDGYGEVFRRYFLNPHDDPRHPGEAAVAAAVMPNLSETVQ